MCKPTEPVLDTLIGGIPNDSAKVISGVSGNRIILLRFNDASQQCTGTSSKSQLSCYMDPEDYGDAKAAALDNKTLQIRGKNGYTSITKAAWSAV